MDAFLSAQNIVKRYAQHTALDGVSINIERGTVFGLLGPNGAGKTTLIRIINHITMPDSGEVTFRRSPTNAGRCQSDWLLAGRAWALPQG